MGEAPAGLSQESPPDRLSSDAWLGGRLRLVQPTGGHRVGSDAALFIPPAKGRMIVRSAPAWERIGKRWFPTFAGVLLVEATKQIYAKPAAARAPRRRLAYTPAPHGL